MVLFSVFIWLVSTSQEADIYDVVWAEDALVAALSTMRYHCLTSAAYVWATDADASHDGAFEDLACPLVVAGSCEVC